MHITRYSRYRGSSVFTDRAGRQMLTPHEPYRFRVLPDTREYRAQDEDMLWFVAGRMFAPLPRACGLWWVIADFQPVPIHDPTLSIEGGTILYIPSVRVVEEEILSDRRRRLPVEP